MLTAFQWLKVDDVVINRLQDDVDLLKEEGVNKEGLDEGNFDTTCLKVQLTKWFITDFFSPENKQEVADRLSSILENVNDTRRVIMTCLPFQMISKRGIRSVAKVSMQSGKVNFSDLEIRQIEWPVGTSMITNSNSMPITPSLTAILARSYLFHPALTHNQKSHYCNLIDLLKIVFQKARKHISMLPTKEYTAFPQVGTAYCWPRYEIYVLIHSYFSRWTTAQKLYQRCKTMKEMIYIIP